MNSRERLIKTFKGQKVDKVPISPWIYKNMVYKYFDISPKDQKWRVFDDMSEKAVEVSDYFGFDFLHRLATPWHKYNEKNSDSSKWIVNVDFKNKSDGDTEITTIKTPEKKLTQIKEFKQTSRYTYIEAITQYFIKDKDDFNQFLKYQPPFEEAIYPTLIDEFNNLSVAKKVLGDKGLIVSCMAGAFNTLNMYRKLEDIMIDPLTDIGFYNTMIKYFNERNFKIIEKIAAHGADVIELSANLATSGVGARFFENYVLEYEKKIIDKIHSLGAFDIYHNCGDADKIMHLYNDLGTNAWGYLTPPPFGDVNIDKALKTINKDIVLIGNIDQVKFLVEAAPKEIDEKVSNLLGKVKERGNFILSTTDWIFDNTSFENIKAFSDAGRRYGYY